jgi:hypothetical protein
MLKLSIAVGLSLSLLSAGCGKKKEGGGGPDCATVVHKIAEGEVAKARAQAAKLSGADQKAAEAAIVEAVARDAKKDELLIKLCTDTRWSDEVLKCIDDAKDNDARKSCLGKLTKEQTDALMAAASAAMPAPAPPPVVNEPAAGSAAPAAADAPPECTKYGAAIDRALKCEKMKSETTAYRTAHEAMTEALGGYGAMDAQGKKQLADGCTESLVELEKQLAANGC